MGIAGYADMAGDVLLSNILPGLPYKLTFAITYHCNSRCTFCNIWKKKPKNELSLDEIQRIGAKADFIKWLNLTGGEPFLRPDIVDIVASFRNLSLLNLTTNSLVSNIAPKVEQMMKHVKGKTVVTLSLDGPPEIHDRLRGIPGNFEKVMQRYEELVPLKKKGLGLYFGFTLSNMNADYLWDTIDAVKQYHEISEHDFHLNVYHYSSHYYGNRKAGLDEKIIKVAEEFMRRKKSLNPVDLLDFNYLVRIRQWVETGKTPMRCKAISSSVFLDPNGNLFPCTIYGRKMGNLRDHGYSLLEIIRSEYAEELRKGIENGRCPQCWTPCEAYQMILGDLKRFRLW